MKKRITGRENQVNSPTEITEYPFFGNDEQQTRTVEGLERAVSQHKGGMHAISGGPASGKSQALSLLREGLEQNKQAQHLLRAEDCATGHLPPGLPPDLAQLITRMNEEAYVQHDIFRLPPKKPGGRDYYVVVAEGETTLTDFRTTPLFEAAAALANDKSKPYDLLWVADVPVRLQSVPIFKPGSPATHEKQRHEKSAQEIKQKFGPGVQFHTLKYDLPTIRESLYTAISSHGEPFAASLNQTTHRPHAEQDKKHWEKAVKAAAAHDEKGFSSAMRVLGTNARTPRAITD